MRSPVSIGLLLLSGVSALACERAEVASGATAPAVSQPAASDPVFDAPAAHELLRFVNQARAQAGLQALALDETLSRAAQAHGREMLERGQLSHQFPGEPDLLVRLGWDRAVRTSTARARTSLSITQSNTRTKC